MYWCKRWLHIHTCKANNTVHKHTYTWTDLEIIFAYLEQFVCLCLYHQITELILLQGCCPLMQWAHDQDDHLIQRLNYQCPLQYLPLQKQTLLFFLSFSNLKKLPGHHIWLLVWFQPTFGKFQKQIVITSSPFLCPPLTFASVFTCYLCVTFHIFLNGQLTCRYLVLHALP